MNTGAMSTLGSASALGAVRASIAVSVSGTASASNNKTPQAMHLQAKVAKIKIILFARENQAILCLAGALSPKEHI